MVKYSHSGWEAAVDTSTYKAREIREISGVRFAVEVHLLEVR